MKKIAGTILLFSQFCISQTMLGQNKSPFLTFNKGLGIATPHSTYSVNFRFRVQGRFLMNTESEEKLNPDTFEARIRRMRIALNGHQAKEEVGALRSV